MDWNPLLRVSVSPARSELPQILPKILSSSGLLDSDEEEGSEGREGP